MFVLSLTMHLMRLREIKALLPYVSLPSDVSGISAAHGLSLPSAASHSVTSATTSPSMLACWKDSNIHCCSQPPHLIFHIDSMLVAKQINCEWRCSCEAPKTSYQEALDLMSRLSAHHSIDTVPVRHVYREFNADADGVCNQVLDQWDVNVRTLQVRVNWDNFRDVDQEGDTIMQLV
jgi:hypothetical protein